MPSKDLKLLQINKHFFNSIIDLECKRNILTTQSKSLSHLLHENIVIVVDSRKDISFQFWQGRSSCPFRGSWWGWSCWEGSPWPLLLGVTRLDQSCLEEGDVVIKAGRDTGVLQVGVGSSQVQGHRPRGRVGGGQQTLVGAKTLGLAEQLQLHLVVRAGQDLGATKLLVELLWFKLKIEGCGGVKHKLLWWVPLRCNSTALINGSGLQALAFKSRVVRSLMVHLLP